MVLKDSNPGVGSPGGIKHRLWEEGRRKDSLGRPPLSGTRGTTCWGSRSFAGGPDRHPLGIGCFVVEARGRQGLALGNGLGPACFPQLLPSVSFRKPQRPKAGCTLSAGCQVSRGIGRRLYQSGDPALGVGSALGRKPLKLGGRFVWN